MPEQGAEEGEEDKKKRQYDMQARRGCLGQ
jgi:hypothetical protein